MLLLDICQINFSIYVFCVINKRISCYMVPFDAWSTLVLLDFIVLNEHYNWCYIKSFSGFMMPVDYLLEQDSTDIISLWEGLASKFYMGWFSRSRERGDIMFLFYIFPLKYNSKSHFPVFFLLRGETLHLIHWLFRGHHLFIPYSLLD